MKPRCKPPRADTDRIFVTGGTGFLGTRVVGDLLARGRRVRCLARSERAARRLLEALGPLGSGGTALQFVFGSLGHQRVERRWLAGCGIVIHAAGALRGAPSTVVRQNVAATRALAEAVRDSDVGLFVLVSSLSVYAPHALRRDAVLDEDCPLDPAPERRGPYVYSKVTQETVCQEVCRSASLPLVVIRPGFIFGPGRSCLSDRIGPRLGRLLAIVDAERRLPYTFVSNCASAVALAALIECSGLEVFNVIDDELPTARDIVNACRGGGPTLRVVAVPGWAARAMSHVYAWCHARSDDLLPASLLPYAVSALYKPLRFSNARAKARLNWRPAVDLHSALHLTTAGPHAAALRE